MNETMMQLCKALLPAMLTAALLAAGWIGYRLRRLDTIRFRLAKIESEIAALQATADQLSRAEEGRIRAVVESEKRKLDQAEWQIAAATSSANREFRAYPAELATTLAANGIRVDALTDEVLLQSFIDQFGRSRSN